MSVFAQSIKNVFAGSMESFKKFPSTIAFALIFTLITIVRIQLDWPQQEGNNFLFNCAHWSLAFGLVFSLMVITGAQSRLNTRRAFIIANILSIIALIVSFLILFYLGGIESGVNKVISSVVIARVIALMLVCYLIFVVLSGVPYDNAKTIDKSGAKIRIFDIDLAKAFFMNLKAFFIALIYGVVIMAGASGVAGAVQALLYQDMSGKVYMYIGAITGFIVFSIFLGYFPDFSMAKRDSHREIAQNQPRFIEILFGYIMVPLMMAFTIVLLLWAGRTVITGVNVSIVALSTIAATYTIGGIWLHMMVSDHQTKVANIYYRFYPVASLLILIFEAWALINQLNKTGLKMTEYWFIMVWIIAVIGAVLLLIIKSKAYILIVAITCILALISVLPFIGFNVLPVKSQVKRLETLLTREEILEDDKLVAAKSEPKLDVREGITDAVIYLSGADSGNLPTWYDKSMVNDITFRKTFGFDMVWSRDDFEPGDSEFISINMQLEAGQRDISEYDWLLSYPRDFEKIQEPISFIGERGTYLINWQSGVGSDIPSLEIDLNNETIIREDMEEFTKDILDRYPKGNMKSITTDFDEMKMILETEEIKLMLIFRNINVNISIHGASDYYDFVLEGIYIKEKTQ